MSRHLTPGLPGRQITELPYRAPSLSGQLPADELAGDHDALDLVGALEDLGDLRVPHEALDRILAGVTVAAEDLYGVGGDLHRGVGGEALGHRRLERRRRAAPIEERRRMMDEEPRAVHLHCHVGQHELEALEGRDRLTELLALLRVGHGRVEGGLADPHRLGAHGRTRTVERAERDLEAFTLLAQAVLDGDLAVAQVERDGRRAADAHLALELANGEAGERRLDQKRRDAAPPAAAVDGREECDDLGVAPVADPELLAVQHVAVAFANGQRRKRGRVRAGAGLRHRERRGDLARGQAREVAALLRLVAGRDDGPAARVLDEVDDRGGRARPGYLLDGDAERESAHPAAAVRFRNVETHQPLLAEELELLGRVGLGLVHVGGQRRDAVARDRAHEAPHGALLVGQVEILGHRSFTLWGNYRRASAGGAPAPRRPASRTSALSETRQGR